MANYPLPSTVNVANFISVRPWLKDEEGRIHYDMWKEQMLCLLESPGLLSFVDGQNPPLSSSEESVEQILWRRTDKLIKGWILGSIGNDALALVARLNSSRDVWLELDNIFNHVQHDNNNNHQIQSQTSEYSQDRRVGEDGEGEATAVVLRRIRNIVTGDQDGLVELQSPSSVHSQRNMNGASQDYTKYLGLRRAITRADWTEARKLLNREEDAKTAIISEIKETALLVAVTVGKRSNDFVRGLIKSMPPAALAEQNSYGNTALHRAAMIGNRETAEMLLNKSPELLYISNNQDYLPVHIAAVYCHKGMLEDLIGFHQMLEEERATNGEDYSVFQKREDKSPFKGQLGASLLLGVITSQFIDVALKLVQKYPDMAILKDQSGADALYELARSNSIFESGAKFKYWWEKWIYSRILLTSSTNYITDNVGNLSSKDEPSKNFSWFGMLIYKIPFVKTIKDKKLLHQQALKLVNCVCEALESLPSPIYERALLLAAHNGIHEVVEVIMEMFPTAINIADTKNAGNIFHVAARQRSENVFNLLHKMKEGKHFFYDSIDSFGNNYMHMCGEQAPTHKLNLVSGAALQMQHELQWFKEMENFVTPSRRTLKNSDGKTPYMLFTEKHQELKSQGEKWMKDTATSCTIAAALIATVVFAAAFTVPGGLNNDNGIPILWDDPWFITFALSDSVSLFSSATSLLMFLSILTSRYAEEDFLYALPRRLCFGVLALFTSITFMVVAFGIAIYITLRPNSKLFLIPVAALACIPVLSFAFSQFPLLIDAFYSTYGPGIFGKKRARTLY